MFVDHGRNEQILAEHKLIVDRGQRLLAGEGHRHGANDGNAGLVGGDGRAINVIHEIFPSPGAELIVLHGGIAVIPGLARGLAVPAHQGAEQAELGPADVHGGLGNAEVSAEIAAPIGIAAGGQVENSGHDGPQPVEV